MKTAKHCRVCGKELPTRRGKVCGRVQGKASHCQRTLQSIKSRSIGLPRSNVDQAALFLQALNCKQIRRKSNNWVEACCPLAPWTHQSTLTIRPASGISVI